MKTTVDFIDAIKLRLSLPSDYAVAKLLGITPASIYGYRAKRDFMGEETACRVAEILNLSPGYVLATVAAERAKTPRVRKAWEGVARKASAAVFALFLGVFALLAMAPAPATAQGFGANTVYYVKCRLRWLFALLALFGCFSTQAAETWTHKEMAGEAAFFALTGVDYLQTRWIASHTRIVTDTKTPDAVIETVTTRHEINPLIGPRPSLTRVTVVFAAEAAAQLAIAHYLPHPYRAAWIGGSVAVELGFTAHNAAVGVRATW